MKRRAIPIILVVASFTLAALAYCEVSNEITAEDHAYITKYLEAGQIHSLPSERGYGDEIRFLIHVQQVVQRISATSEGLPLGTPREPRDLYLARKGLCYDRSRVIEKILRSVGLRTRHISIYSTKNASSAFAALSTEQTASHAVSEVLTTKGWVVVDSNEPWLSIDGNGNPVSIGQIQTDVSDKRIVWSNPVFPDIYKNPFIYIYGLYSRHGNFYPPFNSVPDVNYKELLQNYLQLL
jgi:transglutaminase-like putative cysteine protease